MHGKEKQCILCSGGKFRRKESTIVRPKRRWKVNVIMDLTAIRGGCMDLIYLAQDRVQ
jgi:hypothetical protein